MYLLQRRAGKCWEVVRMCLLTVIEMHHKQLLEVSWSRMDEVRGAALG